MNDLRTRLLVGLVLVLVFAAGAVFGAGVARWSAPAAPRPPLGAPRPEQVMIHELDLDAAQIATLHQIQVAHRGELETVLRDSAPRVKKVVEAIEAELVPHLRPDQVRKLDAWRARRPPPPMPGMGPPPGIEPPPGMEPPPGAGPD